MTATKSEAPAGSLGEQFPTITEAFGNIFVNSLGEIVEFKRRLPLRYEDGCPECLKDFREFHRRFEAIRATKELNDLVDFQGTSSLGVKTY